MPDVTKLSDDEHRIVDQFHAVHYPHFREVRWLGHELHKCPFDLLIYQEIVHQTRPDLIIECGTYKGGSAVFLASICELIGHGEVISIDNAPKATPDCSRVRYWRGDVLEESILRNLENEVAGKQSVMVILDDDHSYVHVLEEMNTYSRFVTRGSYLIVEDSNVNGNPIDAPPHPGPMEAIDQFIASRSDFYIDRSREKYLVSFNPRGYLLRL